MRHRVRALSTTSSRRGLQASDLLALLRRGSQGAVRVLQMLDRTGSDLLSTSRVRRVVSRRSSIVARRQMRRQIVAGQSSLLAAPGGGNFFGELTRIFIPAGRSDTILIGASVRITASAVLRPAASGSSLRRGVHVTARRGQLRQQGAVQQADAGCRHVGSRLATEVSDLVGRCRRRVALHTHRSTRVRRRMEVHSTHAVNKVTVKTILLSIFFLVLVIHSVSHDGHCHQRLRRTGGQTRSLLVTHRGLVLTVARSFGTPLNSVVKCARLLSQLARSRQRHFCLSGVGDSSRRLLGLIDSLLSFRQLSLGGTRIGHIAFGPSRLFRRVRIDFRPLATTGKLALRYRITRRLGKECVDSPLQLQRVIGGLLSGTIGFAPGNRVTLATGCSSSGLAVTVSSAKGNVTARSHRQVFRRFAHLSNTRKRRNFNLKLSVIGGLIILLRNAVSIRDGLKRKDYFAIVLPLCPIKGSISRETLRRGAVSTRSPIALPPVGIVHMLLVSSSGVRLDLATTVLGRRKVSTIYYRRLRRLVRRLHASIFSMLLASVRVPTVGNFSLMGLLHTSGVPRTGAVPIVTMATHDRVSVSTLRRRNFTNYLRGPFAIGRLLLAIGRKRLTTSRTRVARSVRAMDSLGFSTLATFSRSSTSTTRSVVRAFVRRAKGGTSQVRRTLTNGRISKVTTVTRGLLPLFALVKTVRTIPLLG